MKISTRSIWGTCVRTLLILFVPGAEFLGLRLWLHHGLKLRLGWVGFTDYELVVPAAIGFFFFLFALEEDGVCRFKPQKIPWRIHLLSLVFFLFVNFFFDEIANFHSTLCLSLWTLFAFAQLFSGLLLFVPYSFYLRRPNSIAALPCLMIALLFLIQEPISHYLWLKYASYLEVFLDHILQPLLGAQVYLLESSTRTEKFNIILRHPLFRIGIGKGCAGFEGIFLFFYFWLLMATLHRKRFVFLHWTIFLWVGIFAVQLLNLLRIVIILAVGIVTSKLFNYDTSVRCTSFIFHSHVGWLLYAVGFFLLYWAFEKRNLFQPTLEVSPFGLERPQE